MRSDDALTENKELHRKFGVNSIAAVMAITFKYSGVEISVTDPSEAAALIKELSKTAGGESPAVAGKLAIPAPQHVLGTPSISSDELSPVNAETALKFLRTIRDGGQTGGVQAETMMDVFQVSVPKGIGSKSATVNKVIKTIGLRPKSVYMNPKTAAGRLWKPGRKIGQAIQLLEQRLAAH